ncbi:MAG: YybH family protein [Planctomycetota bacterium]|jgi:ketosteroid isomerase-like protein
MKKTTCLTLVLLVCSLICGCQMGPTDEEIINTTMNTWKEAIVAQDVDVMMTGYSEDFASSDGTGKEGVREFMEGATDQGYIDNIEINFETAELTISDDTAEFGPVEVISEMGSMDFSYTLQKEDKKTWRIISSDP